MVNLKARPNVKLSEAYPPLHLAPDPWCDRVGAVGWWVCLVLVAGFWYMAWELMF